MSYSNFDKAIREVLKHEGGYVDHPRDPGGATNYGITIGTLAAWRGKKVTKLDVKKLTLDEAVLIYDKNYWDRMRCDELPSGVDYVVMDFGVNSGIDRSIRYLQAAVGAKVDGKIGPETIKKVQEADPDRVINTILDKRLAFLKGLKTWPTFGKGWTRRVNEVRSYATKLASASAPAVPPADVPDFDHVEIEKDVSEKARASLGAYSEIIAAISETVDDEIIASLAAKARATPRPTPVTHAQDLINQIEDQIKE